MTIGRFEITWDMPSYLFQGRYRLFGKLDRGNYVRYFIGPISIRYNRY